MAKYIITIQGNGNLVIIFYGFQNLDREFNDLFAKSRDFLKFLKYIYVTVKAFMVVCMVGGMSYLMAPIESMSVKVGMRHKILNIWFCIRQNHLEKISHLSR
jgi:hypothetical protein